MDTYCKLDMNCMASLFNIGISQIETSTLRQKIHTFQSTIKGSVILGIGLHICFLKSSAF